MDKTWSFQGHEKPLNKKGKSFVLMSQEYAKTD